MEKNYLYPGEKLIPIEEGESYKDYLLSEVLESAGYSLTWKRFEYASYQPEGIPTNEDKAKSYATGCLILIGRVVIEDESGIVAIAPSNRYHHIPGMKNNTVNPVDKSCCGYSDVKIRYYIDDNIEILRPVWVACLDDKGKEYRSIGPEIAKPYNIIKGDLVINYTAIPTALTIESEEITIPVIYL